MNLYYTPASAQGFLPHFDTHDVFILQLHGWKRWRLFGSPVVLPLVDAKHPLSLEEIPSPQAEHRLDVGDLLYIPRGFVHEAETGDSSSIHLTIGVHTTQWVDLMHDLVNVAAAREVALREALPIKFASESAPLIGERLLALVAAISRLELCSAAVAERARRGLGAGNPVPDGHFKSLDGIDSMISTRWSYCGRRLPVRCRTTIRRR